MTGMRNKSYNILCRSLMAALIAMLPFTGMCRDMVLDNQDNQRLFFGIRGGVDYAIPGDWRLFGQSIHRFEPGAGVSVEGIVNIPLWLNLYLEPGVAFFYNTYTHNDIELNLDDDATLVINPEVRKTGLRVPLMLGYHFDFWENASLGLFAGPQAIFGLTNRISLNSAHVDFVDIDTDLYGPNGNYRRYDIAVAVGAFARLNNWELTGHAAFGLLDMHKSALNFHEYRINISLGYNF